jgi:hypothetical protein
MDNNSGDTSGPLACGILLGALVTFVAIIAALKVGGACLGKLCVIQLPF